MSPVRLLATGPCRIGAPGPPKVTGSDADGEPKLSRETVLVLPGARFATSESVARALTVQGLAERSEGPDFLRPFLDATLPALSALDAVKRAAAAGIDVGTAGDGAMRWRPVRPQQFAALFDGHPPQVDPVFRIEQVAGLHRCWRMYRWHGGAVSEVISG